MSDVKAGRKVKVDPVKVVAWRQARKASIAETAKRFGISPATVKRHSREFGDAAEQARINYRLKREIQEADELEYASCIMEANLAWLHEAAAEHEKSPSMETMFTLLDAANRIVPREYRNKRPGL